LGQKGVWIAPRGRLVSTPERIGRPTLTATGYLLGAGRLLAICGGAFAGARVWRRRVAPEWSPDLATLADLVGALSVVIVLSELLGSIGEFRRAPMITGAVVFGLGSAWWCGRAGRRSKADSTRPAVPIPAPGGGAEAGIPAAGLPTTDVIVASASTALVAAQWSTLVAHALARGVGNSTGPGNGDSLWYHMPFAAAFVHSGWLTRLQYLNGEALVTYYPANTSVLHAVGILALGSDTLSVFVNLALVPIALLAGWCIGARAGVGPSSLAGVAVALTIPVVVVTEAATAKDDLLGIVGLLACIAFVMHSGRERADAEPRLATRHAGAMNRATALYAGLAAGLAIGAKLTLVAPVIALGVCLAVVTPKGVRVATMLRWVGAAFATGGFWYLRNLVRVGNPLPGLGIGLGNVHLPRPSTPSMDTFGTNLLHNIADARIWHQALLPGLRTGFGSAWPVITIVATAAIAMGVVTLRGRDLVAPAVGVMAFGAFVITPGTVWAPQLISKPGVRFITANLFAFNLRYMLPAVAIGLVILPLVARRWRHGSTIATAALGVALAATQLAPQSRQTWSPHEVPVALAVGVLTGAAMVRLTSGRSLLPTPIGTPRGFAICAVAIVAIAVGWPAQRTYARHRYADLDLARFADKVSGASIGYSGFVFSYPLWGTHLQNRVQMIGEHGADGAWHPARSCFAWRTDVRRARVKYVVVPVGAPAVGLGIDLSRWRVGLPGGEPPDEPPESRWTRSDPGARIAFRSAEGAAVYTVSGPPTRRGCR
jgi:hypothetical protein